MTLFGKFVFKAFRPVLCTVSCAV